MTYLLMIQKIANTTQILNPATTMMMIGTVTPKRRTAEERVTVILSVTPIPREGVMPAGEGVTVVVSVMLLVTPIPREGVMPAGEGITAVASLVVVLMVTPGGI